MRSVFTCRRYSESAFATFLKLSSLFSSTRHDFFSNTVRYNMTASYLSLLWLELMCFTVEIFHNHGLFLLLCMSPLLLTVKFFETLYLCYIYILSTCLPVLNSFAIKFHYFCLRVYSTIHDHKLMILRFTILSRRGKSKASTWFTSLLIFESWFRHLLRVLTVQRDERRCSGGWILTAGRDPYYCRIWTRLQNILITISIHVVKSQDRTQNVRKMRRHL